MVIIIIAVGVKYCICSWIEFKSDWSGNLTYTVSHTFMILLWYHHQHFGLLLQSFCAVVLLQLHTSSSGGFVIQGPLQEGVRWDGKTIPRPFVEVVEGASSILSWPLRQYWCSWTTTNVLAQHVNKSRAAFLTPKLAKRGGGRRRFKLLSAGPSFKGIILKKGSMFMELHHCTVDAQLHVFEHTPAV